MPIMKPPSISTHLYAYMLKLLLEDARSDLKAQTIIEMEYKQFKKLAKACNPYGLPYDDTNIDPTLHGYYIRTKHNRYIFLKEGVIPKAILAAEMEWGNNIIYCAVLDHPSTSDYILTRQELDDICEPKYEHKFRHEIQHLLDKYRFSNKSLLDLIPNDLDKSTIRYHNYSPEMNGHMAEIIGQVKKEVEEAFNNLDVLANLDWFKKQFISVIIDALRKVRDNYLLLGNDEFEELLIEKHKFIRELTKKHFSRLLQRVEAVIEKMFDDKKQESIGEKACL